MPLYNIQDSSLTDREGQDIFNLLGIQVMPTNMRFLIKIVINIQSFLIKIVINIQSFLIKIVITYYS